MAVLGPFRGDAYCQTDTGGVASTRQIALRTQNDQAAPADRASWKLDAGASITLFFKHWTSGLAPPGAPTRVVLAAYYETGTATLIRTLHDGAPPTDGASFTLFGTADGTSGGAARAGTVRLVCRLVKTDGAGGVGNYDVDSDGNEPVGNVSNSAQGGLMVRALVSDVGVSAYPAGSQFANGETVALTATHTPPYAVRGHEDVRIDVLDGTAQQIAGATADIEADGTTARNFTVNSGFDLALQSYGAEFVVTGNAQLVFASGATPWTELVDAGTNVEQNGVNVRRQSFFSVDPRDVVDLHTQRQGQSTLDPVVADYTQGVIVAGQVPTWAYVTNSRGEPVNGLTTIFSYINPDGTVVSTQTAGTGPVASNGNRNGWTARAGFDPIGPPGNWTYKAEVTRNGVTSSNQYTFVHVTPVTSNLKVTASGPVLVKPGMTYRYRLLCEIDNAPAAPETLPTWKLRDPANAWSVLASGNWRSEATDTEVINGARYYVDLTHPAAEGRYNLFAEAQLSGNLMKDDKDVRVAADDFDPIGLSAGPA